MRSDNSRTIDRRRLLKMTGTMAASGMIAGCSGSGQGSGGQTDDDTPTPQVKTVKQTSTPALQDLSPEEWRKEMASRAAEELSGGEKIQWVTAIREPDVVEAWQEAWAEKYPELEGKIKPIQGRTSELIKRYRREANSDQNTTDVIRAGSTFLRLLGQGFQLSSMEGIPAYEALPDDFKSIPQRGVMAASCWITAVNTERTDTPPEAFDDLLEDRFAGNKIVMDYTPQPDKAAFVLQNLGKEYLQNLSNQEPRMIKSGFKITQNAAQGQGGVGVSFSSNLRHIFRFADKGLPIAPTNSDMAYLQLSSVFRPPDPIHPSAAKLLADFLMMKENKQLQIMRPGSMATDGETVNPPEAKKYFDGAEIVNITEVTRSLGMSMSQLVTTYQEEVGAPTV